MDRTGPELLSWWQRLCARVARGTVVDVADNPMSGGFDDQSDKTGPPVPAPDAIQEYKVQTALYDAEFGRMSGSNINVITKTGTNDWHGAFFEFFRNDALNANSWSNNARGLPKARLRLNEYGVNLGGPIITNKLFFLGNFEQPIQPGQSTITATMVTSGVYMVSRLENLYMAAPAVRAVNVTFRPAGAGSRVARRGFAHFDRPEDRRVLHLRHFEGRRRAPGEIRH